MAVEPTRLSHAAPHPPGSASFRLPSAMTDRPLALSYPGTHRVAAAASMAAPWGVSRVCSIARLRVQSARGSSWRHRSASRTPAGSDLRPQTCSTRVHRIRRRSARRRYRPLHSSSAGTPLPSCARPTGSTSSMATRSKRLDRRRALRGLASGRYSSTRRQRSLRPATAFVVLEARSCSLTSDRPSWHPPARLRFSRLQPWRRPRPSSLLPALQNTAPYLGRLDFLDTYPVIAARFSVCGALSDHVRQPPGHPAVRRLLDRGRLRMRSTGAIWRWPKGSRSPRLPTTAGTTRQSSLACDVGSGPAPRIVRSMDMRELFAGIPS